MDKLSTQELRGAAFSANLRRAFGAPVEGDLPMAFAVLLDRLGNVSTARAPDHGSSHASPPPPPRRDVSRLGM